MAENRNIDEYLYEACRREKDNLLALGPDFTKIETEALEKFKRRKKSRVRKIWVRAIAAVAAVFIVVNGAVIISDVPEVMAYRDTVRRYFFNLVNNDPEQNSESINLKTSKSIEDVQGVVPFTLPYPHWLPEGYEVLKASAVTDQHGTYDVNFKYNKPNADISNAIQVYITNGTQFANTKPSVRESKFEKQTILEYEVYVRVKRSDSNDNFFCMFYYGDLSVTISGPLDIKVFTQILENFKP